MVRDTCSKLSLVWWGLVVTDAQSMSSSLCDVILYLLCRTDTQDMDCMQLSHQIDF